jgi:Rieske Fe-S protein
VSDRPAWKEDFPISWSDDHYVTRREFTKSLVVVSCAAFVANATIVGLDALRRARPPAPASPVRLGVARAMPVRSARLFDHAGRPCLLIRPHADRFVAFEQKCTHLGCPVLYRPEKNILHCPCHQGIFDANTGKVLAGPPPRPLAAVNIERRGDELWATEIAR